MSEIVEAEAASFTANVNIPTTTETAILNSEPIAAARDAVTVVVLAFVQITWGTGATGFTARIRRGTATSGALVGEANAEALKTAAGSTESVLLMAREERTATDRLQYVLTIAQAGATADGTALQGTILVLEIT